MASREAGWPDVDFGKAEERRVPGGSLIVLRRQILGKPVFDQQIRILLDSQRRIKFVRAELFGASPREGTWDAAKAAAAATEHTTRSGHPEGRVIGRTTFGWAGDPPRAVVQLFIESTKPRLSRRVLRIASESGDVLADLETVRYASTLTGNVFNPNPIASENMPGLLDTSAIPPAAYFVGDVIANDPIGGIYRLEGPYVRMVNRLSPNVVPAASASPTGFGFVRAQTGFQDFNAYAWATWSSEYVDALGFTLDNWPLEIDAHCDTPGGPHYSPLFAEIFDISDRGICMSATSPLGPVHSAEDADVLTHEHMHAILDGLRGMDYTGSGEIGAIHEGSGDYWAASWGAAASSASGFDPACVAEWAVAGGPEAPCLRWVDSGAHYPEDMGHPFQTDDHADGEIWSQFLWDLAIRLGDFQPVDADLLLGVLMTGPHPSFYELADAMRAADDFIYGGANRATITAAMAARGFFPRPPEVSSAASRYPVFLAKAGGPGQYVMAWEDLGVAADGYSIYAGAFATLLADYTHSAASAACNATFTRLGNGWNRTTFSAAPGTFYYVVTAFKDQIEGPCCFLWLPPFGNVAETAAENIGCAP